LKYFIKGDTTMLPKDTTGKKKDINSSVERSNPNLHNLQKKGLSRILLEAEDRMKEKEFQNEKDAQYRKEELERYNEPFDAKVYFKQRRKEVDEAFDSHNTNDAKKRKFAHINIDKYDNFNIDSNGINSKTRLYNYDRLSDDKYSEISDNTLIITRRKLGQIKNDTSYNDKIRKIALNVYECLYVYMNTRMSGLQSGSEAGKRVFGVAEVPLPPEDPIGAMDLAISVLQANSQTAKAFAKCHENLFNELKEQKS